MIIQVIRRHIEDIENKIFNFKDDTENRWECLTQDNKIVVMRDSDGKQLLLAETRRTTVLYLKFCIHCL